MNSKIFIGTPCYGNMLTADYFKSCLQLTALAASKKIEIQFGIEIKKFSKNLDFLPFQKHQREEKNFLIKH